MIVDAMFFHVCWVALLYVALTILRAPAIWGVGTESGFMRSLTIYEPKVSANLSNQFEWPLFFYGCGILSIGVGIQDNYINSLAWLFILGRVIHSIVQVFTNSIRLRGAVFTINFLAVFLMWLRLYFIV